MTNFAVGRRKDGTIHLRSVASTLAVGVVTAVLMIPATLRAASPGPGEAVVRTVIDSIRKLPNVNDPSQRGRVLEAVNRLLGISALAQASLGDRWRKLDKAERTRFVTLFTRTLEKFAYPRAARALSTVQVEFGGEENRGVERLVHTKISNADGGQIAVDYRLSGAGSRFKIADVYLDNQSLAKLVGERVQEALKQGGYDKLVADMKKRVEADDLAERAAETK